MIYVYAEIANDYLMHASSGMEYICVRWAKIICKYLRERDIFCTIYCTVIRRIFH